MRPPVLPPLTFSAALLAIGAPAAVAPQIQIGGSNGWIVQGAYDDVTAAVGDVLSFSYTAGYHDVMLIQEGNDACDFSGGSLLDETGSFQFELTEPGEFVFACTKGSHCAGGAQHVRVSVPAPAAESGGQQQVGPPTIEQLDSMCPAEMAACRSAGDCMDPLQTSLVPENSEDPPSGTAEIDAVVACFMQGTRPVWDGTTAEDLFAEYSNIFRFGNRNAASHLWATFVLDRAWQMPASVFQDLMGSFCPVSGSPVRIVPSKRFRVTLEASHGAAVSDDSPPQRTGYVSHCCWPCTCDAQDFLKVDTKTVDTADGPREYWVTVMGNPCLGPRGDAIFSDVFVSPFDGSTYTLSSAAREVRCAEDGSLIGATLSDAGYPIIGMMHESTEASQTDIAPLVNPVPGRLQMDGTLGVAYSDARDMQPMCDQRAATGYASGMGEIFRQVASVVQVAFDSNREYCLGDVTGDLEVNVSDLLAVLGAFGKQGDEAMGFDVVENAIVDVSDLLALLGEFGNTC